MGIQLTDQEMLAILKELKYIKEDNKNLNSDSLKKGLSRYSLFRSLQECQASVAELDRVPNRGTPFICTINNRQYMYFNKIDKRDLYILIEQIAFEHEKASEQHPNSPLAAALNTLATSLRNIVNCLSQHPEYTYYSRVPVSKEVVGILQEIKINKKNIFLHSLSTVRG